MEVELFDTEGNSHVKFIVEQTWAEFLASLKSGGLSLPKSEDEQSLSE